MLARFKPKKVAKLVEYYTRKTKISKTNSQFLCQQMAKICPQRKLCTLTVVPWQLQHIMSVE